MSIGPGAAVSIVRLSSLDHGPVVSVLKGDETLVQDVCLEVDEKIVSRLDVDPVDPDLEEDEAVGW